MADLYCRRKKNSKAEAITTETIQNEIHGKKKGGGNKNKRHINTLWHDFEPWLITVPEGKAATRRIFEVIAKTF